MEQDSPLKIVNRSANTPFPGADDLSPARLGVSGEQGPKLSELYGFIFSITIVVAAGSLIIWAYVPEYWLNSIGIYYYPKRDSAALPVPTYVLVTIILAIGVYVGLNFLATPPPTSLKSMFEEFSDELVNCDDESLSDIGINKVNELLNEMN